MKKFLGYLLLAISLPFFFFLEVSADILYLQNGRSVEGKIISKDKAGVVLKVAGGTIEFGHREIASIEVNEVAHDQLYSPKEIYLQKKKEIDKADPKAHFALGEYCFENQLFTDAEFEFQEAIALDKSFAQNCQNYLQVIDGKKAVEILNKAVDSNNFADYIFAEKLLLEIKEKYFQFYKANSLERLLRIVRNNISAAKDALKLKESVKEVESREGFFVVETDNFKIFAEDARRGRQIAKQIEEVRDSVADKIGISFFRDWKEKCSLYIYDDRDKFLQDSGAPAWAAGWQRTFFRVSKEIRGGQVTLSFSTAQRSIMVYRRAPKLLSNVIPHEIAHSVYNGYIEGKQIPLWFNEGIAVYCERSRRFKKKDILKSFNAKQSYPLAALLQLEDYPREQTAFYTQSASIVKFLIEECQSLNFIKLSKRIKAGEEFDKAFFDVYRGYFKNSSGLEEAWLEYLET